MFEGINFGDMGKMLQGLQDQAKKMHSELASRQYSAKTGGGMVKVTMNGAGEVIDIDIDDALLEDKTSLQILLIAACNDAIKMVEDAKKESAMNIFGGINPFAQR